MYGMGYGKLMVGVVGRIQIIFLEVANGVLEWHQDPTYHSHHELPISHSRQYTPSSLSLFLSSLLISCKYESRDP